MAVVREAIEKEAMLAAFTWAAHSLVFFAAAGAHEMPKEISSGTLFRTPRGRLIVLTAAHCVDEVGARPHALGFYQCKSGIHDALDAAVVCPNGVDVALVTLRGSVSSELSRLAVDPSVVPSSDEAQAQINDFCVIAGFPARISFSEQVATRVISLKLGSITHGTTIEGVDERGRYRVSWDEGEVQHQNQAWERFGMFEGKVHKLPHPGGISGGALWHFPGEVPKGTVWTPAAKARLIGVPVSFLPDSRIEMAEPVSAWGEWFREQIATMDA